jgi:putative flippase GtrA
MAQIDTVKLTRKQNIIQIIKFTAFSATAGIIEVVSFTLLNELSHMPYWPSYLIALFLSVLYNFTVNRRFTFKSAANIPMAMLKVIGYYCVFTPLSTWWGDALTSIGWNEYLVLAITMIANFVTEFLFTRFVVYRHSINTNRLGQIENEKYAQATESVPDVQGSPEEI